MGKDEALAFIETVTGENSPLTPEGTIDLDQLAERLKELRGQVESYRTSLTRHISARCSLLGRDANSFQLESQDVRQLLEIVDTLDREFRERFHLAPEIPGEPAAAQTRADLFLSGR